MVDRLRGENAALQGDTDRLGQQVLGLQRELKTARATGAGQNATVTTIASPTSRTSESRVHELEKALQEAAVREVKLRKVSRCRDADLIAQRAVWAGAHMAP